MIWGGGNYYSFERLYEVLLQGEIQVTLNPFTVHRSFRAPGIPFQERKVQLALSEAKDPSKPPGSTQGTWGLITVFRMSFRRRGKSEPHRLELEVSPVFYTHDPLLPPQALQRNKGHRSEPLQKVSPFSMLRTSAFLGRVITSNRTQVLHSHCQEQPLSTT